MQGRDVLNFAGSVAKGKGEPRAAAVMAVMRRGITAAVLPIAWRASRRRAIAAGIAHATAAGLTLRHPAAHWIAAAVIGDDLVNSQHWPSARQVADNAWLEAVTALVPGLTDGRSCDAENRNRSEDGEYLFHGSELGVRELSTQLHEAYSAPMKIFFTLSKLV
jgi:hypothetical protein